MTVGSNPIIICENLVKIYKVADLEVVALQGLDLLVERGEMLGIVGASGSGKTTLLNTLGGMDRPSAGRVAVDGIDLLSLSDSALNQYKRRKVGFVWQQAGRNLVPYLSAQENVELPMVMASLKNHKERLKRSDFLLDMVGLFERRKHHLNQLSGGEQQRVAISVALANDPVLLLGDEPTGEVDSLTSQSIMDTFHNLSREMGVTTVIVTHDPRIVEQVDRVVAIRDGKISTETIRKVGQLERVMTGEYEPIDKQDALEPDETTYQEFAVLDSAGRLQIPKEVREQFGIEKRAHLEVTEDSIVIRPTANDEENASSSRSLEDQIARLFEHESAPPQKPTFRGWLRLKKRK